MDNNDKIKLDELFTLTNPEEYKLHLACQSGDRHPLDVYVADRKEWVNWNRWRGDKNDWTRDFIFSFIEFYPISNTYLFGGVFKVLRRYKNRNYVLQDVDSFNKWEGRLICTFKRYQGLRGRAFYLENLLDSFDVHSLLPERYTGEKFCGYENVNHSFSVLRAIISSEKPDWKASLMAIKGVYLILDIKNGKTYVGSAYGDAGIWSRLSCYIYTGHGYNDELVKTIKKRGNNYAVKNFKFSILEVFSLNTPDEIIIERESHWKNVMLSRQFGYNKN